MEQHHSLQPIELIRLTNFLSIQGRTPGYGAPTAKSFAAHLSGNGANLTSSDLTAIYQRTKPISTNLAVKIEVAMGLGQGWLSESHEFFYALTAKEMAIHRALSKLPSEVKLNLAAIISALSSDESST